MLKLAFGCWAGVGKTTACNYLNKKYNAVVVNFADGIYDLTKGLYSRMGIPFQKNRPLLIAIGNVAKKHDPNYWVNEVKKKYEFHQKIHNQTLRSFMFCVGDVRYNNEFYFLRKEGFIMVKLERPGVEPQSDEHELDDKQWDVCIKTEDIQTMYKELDKLVENSFKILE